MPCQYYDKLNGCQNLPHNSCPAWDQFALHAPSDTPLEKFCLEKMTPLDDSQKSELQHVIFNGLQGIVNNLELSELAHKDKEPQRVDMFLARAKSAIDTLKERLRRDFGL